MLRSSRLWALRRVGTRGGVRLLNHTQVPTQSRTLASRCRPAIAGRFGHCRVSGQRPASLRSVASVWRFGDDPTNGHVPEHSLGPSKSREQMEDALPRVKQSDVSKLFAFLAIIATNLTVIIAVIYFIGMYQFAATEEKGRKQGQKETNVEAKKTMEETLGKLFQKGYVQQREVHTPYAKNFDGNGKCARAPEFVAALDYYITTLAPLVLFVTGSDGIGNTSLVHEFAKARLCGGLFHFVLDSSQSYFKKMGVSTADLAPSKMSANFKVVVEAAANYKPKKKGDLEKGVLIVDGSNYLFAETEGKFERMLTEMAFTVKQFVENGQCKVVFLVNDGLAKNVLTRVLSSCNTVLELRKELTEEQCVEIVKQYNARLRRESSDAETWAHFIHEITGGRVFFVHQCAEGLTKTQTPPGEGTALPKDHSAKLQWVLQKTDRMETLFSALRQVSVECGIEERVAVVNGLVQLAKGETVTLPVAASEVLVQYNVLKRQQGGFVFDNELDARVFADDNCVKELT